MSLSRPAGAFGGSPMDRLSEYEADILHCFNPNTPENHEKVNRIVKEKGYGYFGTEWTRFTHGMTPRCTIL